MILRMLWIGLVLSIASPVQAESQVESFEQGVELLRSKNFQDVESAIEIVTNSGHEDAEHVLQSLLDGEIYRNRTNDNALVRIVGKDGKNVLVTGFFDDSGATESVRKRKVKRVSINNKIRGLIKTSVASLQLNSSDPDARYEAVARIISSPSEAAYQSLQQRAEIESDDLVKSLLSVAIASMELGFSKDKNTVLEAIETLSGSLMPEARNALQAFADSSEDEALVVSANKGLKKIADKAAWAGRFETLFFGISLGSVLVLAAIGLAITFGVMGVINMAHGELIMLGAYTTYVIQLLMPNHIGLSILVAIPAAFVVSGLVGIAIERGVIRFLYGRPLETLLATFGISLILQQAVRSVFSPLNRSVETPEWMSGAIEINPLLSLTLNRVYIILFCFMVFAALFALLRYSRLGIEVRAVSQNRAMAKAMGVKSDWVDAMTFGLGSGIAGIAGVALSQLTNVGPNLGQAYIIDSFMVVVFGGVGNLWGTLVAGLTMGVANKVMEPWAGAVLAKILLLVFIILFIQKRPKGLFPQKGRSAEG